MEVTMATMTRYQILITGTPTVENFTATEKVTFAKRVAALKRLGVKFTVWDTRRNGLADLFRF
jgi:hypothetical protein